MSGGGEFFLAVVLPSEGGGRAGKRMWSTRARDRAHNLAVVVLRWRAMFEAVPCEQEIAEDGKEEQWQEKG